MARTPIRPPEKPAHIARDYKIGNTRVIIATDYCCKPEEVPAILDRIARKALEHFRAAANAKETG